jgi:hypothetical protein
VTRPRTATRRIAASAVLAAALLVGTASPAAADAAGPTEYRAEVTAIEPAAEGMDARIIGGDAFLELRVDPGVSAVVLGYQGEPYLRFGGDGTVEHNVRSPTTYLNEDRTGAADIPDSADPEADPVWEPVADGGRYAWHDHRTHWMAPSPPDVEPGETLGGDYDPWRVPIRVEGADVEIQGTLTYEGRVSPLPWVAVGLVVAGVLAVAGRRAPVPVAALAVAVTAALATVLGRAEFSVSPAVAGANPLLWALPACATVLAAVAVGLARRPQLAVVAVLASVAALSAWALLRLGVLVNPVLPSDMPGALDRAGVAASLGVAVGAAWLAVTSGALAFTALDDDPGPGEAAPR